MKKDFKLLSLPFVVLIALMFLSMLFSSKITLLRSTIDNVYYGNFIPVHRLHIIKENYIQLILNRSKAEQNKKIISHYWEKYKEQYKTKREREVVNKIDKSVQKSLLTNSIPLYIYMSEQIELLIQYEVSSARTQRDSFLIEYKQLRQVLLYSQILIVLATVIFIFFVIKRIIQNNKEMEQLIDKYRLDSLTDSLTGLYNRKHFDNLLDDAIQTAGQNSKQNVFVMIDIDYFKQYNDTYGHDAGDIALKTVASTLDEIFCDKLDYVFRLGGEEFGIIIFDTTLQSVEQRLITLQETIKAKQIQHSASKTGFLTLSMGVVAIDKKIAKLSRSEVYKLADKKLYNSKKQGRDQYTL